MTNRALTILACALGALLLASGCSDQCDPDELGTFCTIVGSGDNGYDRDADSTAYRATEARMSLPQDVLAAPDGTLYVLDWNNHRLRHLGSDGMLRWVAGRGELGGTLDDPASGDFNHPTNIIFDESGTSLVMAAWHNSMIRTVDLETGEVSDSCGDGRRAYFGDDGPAIESALDLPASVTWSPSGDLVIMDQANQVLRAVGPDGQIRLLAGRCIVDAPAPGGPGPCADGEEPVQCPPDPSGLPSGKYVCGDPAEWCSSPCTPGYAGDELPASAMRMSQPFGQSATPAGRIAYDAEGSLYFADTGNHLIRRIDPDGIVHRVAGQAPVDGVPQRGFGGDGGPARDALLDYPVDLAFDEDGTLYFTDVHNHCVRAIAPDGTISTAVGVCGERGFAGDGLPPEQARLNLPFGVEYRDGVLYVSDTGNNVIRQLRLR